MRHDEPPDFLGIGGTRCGTTWLYENLRAHPQLWLPPVKELHYFDRSPEYPSPGHVAAGSLPARLFGRNPEQRSWRREAGRDLGRAPAHPASLPWKLRYYLGRPDDRWYLSLFRPGRGLVRGEITPSYSFLSRQDVEHVRRLMPEVRVIFVMRDPVERMWSGFRRQGLADEAIRRRLAGSVPERRSDYLATLDTWGSVLGPARLHVDFYDHIAADPAALLTRVLSFLGVDASPRLISASVGVRTNAAPARPMPDDVRLALTRRYLPLMVELAARFDGPPQQWLARAQQLLDAAPGGPEALPSD